MSQGFDTVDVLRLEVEETPTGLVNMVKNPSGELDGWGWVTPVASTTLQGSNGTDQGATGQKLVFTAITGASYFYTESMPVIAGQYIAASWVAPYAANYYRARIEWLNSVGSVLSSTTASGYLTSSFSTSAYGPFLAPASTVSCRLRFDMYKTTGGANPLAGENLLLRQVTVAKAATSGALGSSRSNIVTNPSFETNANDWAAQGSASVARTSAIGGAVGSWAFSITGAGGAYTVLGPSGGQDYAFQAKLRAGSVARSIRYDVTWISVGGTYTAYAQGLFGTDTTGSWTLNSKVLTAPSWAVAAIWKIEAISAAPGEVHYLDAVMVEPVSSVGSYFDGATPDAGGVDYAWTGTANNSTSTATSSNLGYIEPVTYVNVLGPSHDIKVVREELNVGTLTATILDADLDPSQDDLIRPGKRCRLMQWVESEAEWQAHFTGKVSHASVSYHLKDPDVPESKRARIELTAVDGLAQLANQKRAEGVATVDELPYVLEGCGVPWDVNGSGNQVPSATVVSLNDNASALDQIAVTRDSVMGVAYMDRNGVLHAQDSQGTNGIGLGDWAVSDLDLSYNTDDCINEVTIKFLRLNPVTGETEEIPYGPYRNEDSIAEWGVRQAEFTIQGMSEETSDIADFADAILAANGTPVVTINSVTIPVTVRDDLEGWLQSAVPASYDFGWGIIPEFTAFDHDDRRLPIRRIEHSITPDKWVITLGLSAEGTVSAPTFVPSPQTGAGGKTIGQLLRPAGEVTMWAGPSAPDGWLACNGGSYLVSAFPGLFDAIGYTYGGAGASFNVPNFTDRFPIGAGTKALGTSGGDATKAVPAHTHSTPNHTHTDNYGTGTVAHSGSANAATGGAQPRIGLIAGSTSGTHDHAITGGITSSGAGTTGAASGSAFDVMNPWRAINFIIRT